MIFPAEQARLILAGRKTQVRRLAVQRPNLPRPSLDLSETERLRTTGHRVGRVYPLERYARGDEVTPSERVKAESGRSKPPVVKVADMRCLSLRLQGIGDVDLKDARAEGFRTTGEFRDAWVRSRDRRWVANTLADLGCTAPLCDAVLTRFDTHHATTLVWVFTFEIVETPRLLKATASFDDYTDRPSRASSREPEALTEGQLVALTRFRPALDDARRRQPLATHAHNIARELDEIRSRVADENLSRGAKRTIRQIEIYADRLKENLGG